MQTKVNNIYNIYNIKLYYIYYNFSPYLKISYCSFVRLFVCSDFIFLSFPELG